MAMEKDYIIHETHTRSITAIGSSFVRREIFLGFEDGIIKSVEVDTGKHVQTYAEHKGWVTSFLYWTQCKYLFSAANDSVVMIIGPGGNVLDKVFIGTPVYCMSLNHRRKEIIFGVNNGLQFHKIFENKVDNHYIDVKPNFLINEHSDIVKCVLTSDSRIYSAGYDGALLIYDCPYTGLESAVKCYKNRKAHDAGISCLLVEKDSIENNTWLVTGSFDKTLKIWTNDGKLIHKFEGFFTAITGICYVPKNKTVWCVAGTNSAYIYDPKSGENVTDFIDTFMEQTQEKYYLQLIKYFNDFNILVTSTSRKQLVVFKYNPLGCLTSIKHRKSLDSICYTQKAPILIFTGDSDNIFKWEQTQSNQLIYNSERLIKTENAERESSTWQDHKTSCYSSSFNLQNSKHSGKTILKLLFCEKLDLIIAASEDSSIYIWGFDDEAVRILKNMNSFLPLYENEEEYKTGSEASKPTSITESWKVLINENERNQFDFNKNDDNANIENMKAEVTKKRLGDDSVTNRVAGYKLKAILTEHTSCVSAITLVENSRNIYLLSAGWDRRICIWDLENLRLFDVFRNKNSKILEELELASDGHILDICYCEKYNCFGYSSTDSLCYIRSFSAYGSEMVLENILQGHKSEVYCITWSILNDQWITGGEDSTIRFWSKHGECINIINCSGTVNCFCIDPQQGSLIVGVHDTIKVYEIEEWRLVQTNIGHIDSIRDIILIQERGCFISVSWDKTMKIWRSWRKPSLTQKKIELSKEEKFDSWIWEQLKKSTSSEEM